MTTSKEPEAPSREQLLKLCDALIDNPEREGGFWAANIREVARAFKSRLEIEMQDPPPELRRLYTGDRLSAQGQATREQIARTVCQATRVAFKCIFPKCQETGSPYTCEDEPVIADAILALSPVEPRPQPDAAGIRNTALRMAADVAASHGAWATRNDIEALMVTADKQEGG